MKHCLISLLCNELPYLKQKLNFLYIYFNQIIFIDYDILNNCNSKDGSIQFINDFDDYQNKITLLTDFNPEDIEKYNGYSIVEKQKMFAYASRFIKDDNEIIWATDLDEFFEKNLIDRVEECYNEDEELVSIDVPHINFVYNQYNRFYYPHLFYIVPRITRHVIGKIYGHCNFVTYGKTKIINDIFLYHFAYVGYKRCKHKLELFNKNNNKHQQEEWLEKYMNCLEKGDKYIEINHPGKIGIMSVKYEGNYPDYIDIDTMINELNYYEEKEKIFENDMYLLFNEKDKDLFKKYIENSTTYFEFGSGGSTFYANCCENIKKIYSVESDNDWINKIKKNINVDKINFIYVDIDSKPNTYGRPGNTPPAGEIKPVKPSDDIEAKKWSYYSESFKKLTIFEFEEIDLFLVDGRFRVACLLKMFEYLKEKQLILFDDFKSRYWFHEIKNYFNIIDEVDGGQMVVLKKKDVERPKEEIIKRYEIDYR